MTNQNPTLVVFVGPMFSSKTTKLLFSLERFKLQKKHVMVFKPAIDDRYSFGEVVSHSGWRHDAMNIKEGADILKSLSEAETSPDVVAVDEAFMIDGIANALIEIYKKGITVIVSSIQLSANFKPFEEIMYMMPYATKIEICPAVCAVCSEDAYYTFSKFEVGHSPVIGGSDLYEPRSFKHYPPIKSHD